ncbi:MAG: cytochrome c3 family protein [Nitrospirae bacterium]|nr:cytochrome c3 family protein [Nitrospirota bacterium]
MKNRYSISLMLLLTFVLGISGCKVKTEAHKEPAVEEMPLISRYNTIALIPCFGCHDVEAFFGAKNAGIFSHERHYSLDVHCNQCHDIKGHEHPKLISGTCSGCHSLGVLSYKGGDVGKVSFNHSFHAKAFSCNECHPKIFPMKKGLRSIKMDDMYQGKSCGACHNGQKAFPPTECERCHKQVS